MNEARVLKSSTVLEYLDTNKIDYIVYDWTERNENISAVLESYGRSGVPLYLLFKGDGTDAIIQDYGQYLILLISQIFFVIHIQ